LTPALLGTLALALAGCGGAATGTGSTATARTLLRKTLSGSHPVDSGILSAAITLIPTGSKLLTQPVSLTFGGPFQSRGRGRLPESDFAVAIHFAGHTGALSILSTGTEGFVTLSGTAYKLPASRFASLESGLASVGAGGSTAGSSLSRLGIHPETWLADPRVVGTARIAGVETDHLHGRLALAPLLSDLSKVLAEAATLSASSATSVIASISPADQTKIAHEVRDAGFDLWTTTGDHTIARLRVTATLPVSGTLRRELGGLTSAKLELQFGYRDVGAPQTIIAPAASRPYAQFTAQLSAVVTEVEQLAETDAEATAGTGTATGATATAATGTAATGTAATGTAGTATAGTGTGTPSSGG
jgi:hypothetical protein